MPTDLQIVARQGAETQPETVPPAELERFWQDLYTKVKEDLERLDQARSKSEEDARNLWLRS